MIETSSNVFARRARLSTAAIALALALTIAALAAVLSSSDERALEAYQLESPIAVTQTSASAELKNERTQ